MHKHNIITTHSIKNSMTHSTADIIKLVHAYIM